MTRACQGGYRPERHRQARGRRVHQTSSDRHPDGGRGETAGGRAAPKGASPETREALLSPEPERAGRRERARGRNPPGQGIDPKGGASRGRSRIARTGPLPDDGTVAGRTAGPPPNAIRTRRPEQRCEGPPAKNPRSAAGTAVAWAAPARPRSPGPRARYTDQKIRPVNDPRTGRADKPAIEPGPRTGWPGRVAVGEASEEYRRDGRGGDRADRGCRRERQRRSGMARRPVAPGRAGRGRRALKGPEPQVRRPANTPTRGAGPAVATVARRDSFGNAQAGVALKRAQAVPGPTSRTRPPGGKRRPEASAPEGASRG